MLPLLFAVGVGLQIWTGNGLLNGIGMGVSAVAVLGGIEVWKARRRAKRNADDSDGRFR
jgi:hypothetical protein